MTRNVFSTVYRAISDSLLPLMLFLIVLGQPAMTAIARAQSSQSTDAEWVDLKGGLRYLDLELGEGEREARPGRTVQVHYTGWLEDGTQFQSSRDSGRSFAFKMGAGQVIPGWEKGVRGMKAGGRRRLEIPPKLAYGKRGRPGIIPRDATLIFEIELLSVQ